MVPSATLLLLLLGAAPVAPPEPTPGDELIEGAVLFDARGPRGESCRSCHARPGLPHPLEGMRGHASPSAPVAGPLRGLLRSAPYGQDASVPTLAEATSLALQDTWGEAPRRWRRALELWLRAQPHSATPSVDEQGLPTATATALERQGEALFRQPRPALGGRSCASCHVPAHDFTDGQPRTFAHGTAAPDLLQPVFDTPSLRELSGRGALLALEPVEGIPAAVSAIDARHALGLGAAEQAALGAWLQAVGRWEPEPVAAPQPLLRSRLEWAKRHASESDLPWGPLQAVLSEGLTAAGQGELAGRVMKASGEERKALVEEALNALGSGSRGPAPIGQDAGLPLVDGGAAHR